MTVKHHSLGIKCDVRADLTSFCGMKLYGIASITYESHWLDGIALNCIGFHACLELDRCLFVVHRRQSLVFWLIQYVCAYSVPLFLERWMLESIGQSIPKRYSARLCQHQLRRLSHLHFPSRHQEVFSWHSCIELDRCLYMSWCLRV